MGYGAKVLTALPLLIVGCLPRGRNEAQLIPTSVDALPAGMTDPRSLHSAGTIAGSGGTVHWRMRCLPAGIACCAVLIARSAHPVFLR